MTVPQPCSAASAAWLPALAAARPPGSDAQADRADRAVVQLSAPVPSSSAVAGLLLQAFVDSTASQARAREAHPLPRSLEISVVGGVPPAAAAQAPAAPAAPEQQSQQQSQQQAAPLVVQFAATDEGADMQQVEQAARLFEVRAFGAPCLPPQCIPLSIAACVPPLRTPSACFQHPCECDPLCRPTGACTPRRRRATCTAACGGGWRRWGSSWRCSGLTAERDGPPGQMQPDYTAPAVRNTS